MQLHNLDGLFSSLGDLFAFEAIDRKDTKNINCPAERTLLLKPGSHIMLLWNKSRELKNGSKGVLIGIQRENISVNFENVGKVLVKRETWQKYASDGRVLGSRTQFPLALRYAITCHKSQGLTLSAAVVHCSKEFVPGLTYVEYAVRTIFRCWQCKYLWHVSGGKVWHCRFRRWLVLWRYNRVHRQFSEGLFWKGRWMCDWPLWC